MTYQSAIVTAVESAVHSFIHSVSEKFGVSEDELLSMWNGAEKTAEKKTTTKTEKKTEKPAEKKTTTKKEKTNVPEAEGNAMSAGVLAGMKKDELVALAKSRGLSHTGTKDVIIARLTGGGKAPSEKSAVPAKKPAEEKVAPKVTPIIKQSAEIRIGQNKFKNYEHNESGLVFDNINGKVIGKQNVDGTISTLSDADIEQCKKYGFTFIMPSNLNKKEAVDDEEPEDMVEEKDPEVVDDEDADENVEDFIEDDGGDDYEE